MKAVLLAAGEGTRLRPLSLARPKHLFYIAGKPIIEHTLNRLKMAGITDVLLVVSYMKEKIMEFVGDGSRFGMNVEFVDQVQPLGTAHATKMAKDFLDNETFVLANADVMVKSTFYRELIDFFGKNKNSSILSLVQVKDPSKYGVVEIEDGKIKKIVEKPEHKKESSNLINAGIYLFQPEIFNMIERTKKSPRGEFEITDSIQMLINEGYDVRGFVVDTWWIDIGRPWELLEINEYLLNEIDLKIEGIIEEGAHLQGPVGIGKETIIRSGAYIIGPVLIGEKSDIGPNTYIRPFTYIGDNVRIGNAVEVKNSIISHRCRVGHLSYVGDSIIGENCNFGAGTKVANLRLDEKTVKVTIKGKREDSGRRKLGVIMADNVKTGINVSLMPGVSLGPNSAVGPEVLVSTDIPPNTFIFKKQDLERIRWLPL